MEFIETVAPAAAEGAVAAMYRRQQSAWGYVPNYAKVFSHRPEVMVRWAQLLAEIRRPMDPRRFELVTFAAAHEMRNAACTLAHGRKLREFFSDEDIAALAAQQPVASLGEADAAMLRFTRRIARDASAVTAEEVQALRHLGFSDAEVFDIAAVAAGRAFFAKLLDALGVAPDSPALAIGEPLLAALAVGRPIDRREVVRLAEPEASPP
jgi:uncharacterized peroxidase-related enzyme